MSAKDKNFKIVYMSVKNQNPLPRDWLNRRPCSHHLMVLYSPPCHYDVPSPLLSPITRHQRLCPPATCKRSTLQTTPEPLSTSNQILKIHKTDIMSSLTAQESSESNPQNPVNKGTTSAPGTGSDPAVPFGTGSKTDSGFESGLSSKADKVRFHHVYTMQCSRVHNTHLQ